MMELLLVYIVGLASGWWICVWLSRMIIKASDLDKKDVSKEYDEIINKIKTVHVDIQKDGDIFRLYNTDTGQFLAQGKNAEEITVILRSRFPSTVFTADMDNVNETKYSKYL